ncbi:MAG: hypothetical protein JWP34_5303 [Massilia sp.]|nr:hypothetical protein [Massilia sp.]
MAELHIDEELKAWIDPLSPDEYALLESSILQDGCRDPLVVWGGYLLDGHNRYEICQKHGIAFTTFEKAGLTTKVDVKIWMIQNQMGKRNATDFARTALALKLKPLLEQRARERMQAGKVDPTQNSAEGVGETRQAVAKVAGVSHDTVRKVEKIIENASAEVIEQVRTGEISINAAAKTVSPPKVVSAPAADPALSPAPLTHESTASPDVDPENFGPSPEEIAAAVRAEAEQIEYIKNLLASDDDPLALALADLKQKSLEISALRSQNAGHQNTINDQIRMIKALRSKLTKLERQA